MDLMEEVDAISLDAIVEQQKQEEEDRVIPKGTYEGLVISWVKVEESEKQETDQFKNVPLYRVGITFYDCPEYEKKKTGWFKFTTSKILGDSGRPKTAYTTAVNMVKALEMPDVPFADVLEQAKVTRLKYRVGLFESPEGKKYNFLQGVSVIS